MKEIKKKKYTWENFDEFPKCDQIDCDLPGKYKAPKTPRSNEKYNFCLKHVTNYNKRWNYFAGKSQDEIYKFLREDQFLSKPTRPISETVSSVGKNNFDFDFIFEFNDNTTNKKTNNRTPIKNKSELELALELFELELPFDNSELKKKYNLLVKENHPDLHGQDLEKEKLLKKINNYYIILQKIVRQAK